MELRVWSLGFIPEGPSPYDWVPGFWATGIIVQVLGKYMILRYTDP